MHSPPDFAVSDHYVDSVLVVRISGEVDLMAAPLVVDRLRAALARGDERVVLDCERVSFLDSKMVEAILSGATRLRERGGDLAVSCRDIHVRRVLEVVGADAVVPIRDSVREAIMAMRGGVERRAEQ